MEDLFLFVAVGFAAQIVDGALGMAYGVSATSVLLNLGITPAVASATVHAAEVFTTGASSISHWRMGNVKKDLFWKLVLPGAVGGGLGAYLLVSVPNEKVQLLVSVYLFVLGVVILLKALRQKPRLPSELKHTRALGFVGAVLDAIGGGGWGATVTGSLIGRGMESRFVIGTSNAAEFFITTVISLTFLGTIGLELWPMITGLIIGGVVAAPFGAFLARRIPDRPLMGLVGVLIMGLSARNLFHHLG